MKIETINKKDVKFCPKCKSENNHWVHIHKVNEHQANVLYLCDNCNAFWYVKINIK